MDRARRSEQHPHPKAIRVSAVGDGPFVSAGSLAHFGTYSVDAAGTTLTYHVERSSFPNWDDTDQNWSIIKLVGDDLTLGVARTSSGGKAELVYKRVK